MDPATVAILIALGRIGIDALIAFLEHPRASEAEVIAALKLAKDKSLEEYIRLDAEAQAKLKALQSGLAGVPPPPPPPA